MHAKTVLRFALVVQIFVRDNDDDDIDDDAVLTQV